MAVQAAHVRVVLAVAEVVVERVLLVAAEAVEAVRSQVVHNPEAAMAVMV